MLLHHSRELEEFENEFQTLLQDTMVKPNAIAVHFQWRKNGFVSLAQHLPMFSPIARLRNETLHHLEIKLGAAHWRTNGL